MASHLTTSAFACFTAPLAQKLQAGALSVISLPPAMQVCCSKGLPAQPARGCTRLVHARTAPAGMLGAHMHHSPRLRHPTAPETAWGSAFAAQLHWSPTHCPQRSPRSEVGPSRNAPLTALLAVPSCSCNCTRATRMRLEARTHASDWLTGACRAAQWGAGEMQRLVAQTLACWRPMRRVPRATSDSCTRRHTRARTHTCAHTRARMQTGANLSRANNGLPARQLVRKQCEQQRLMRVCKYTPWFHSPASGQMPWDQYLASPGSGRCYGETWYSRSCICFPTSSQHLFTLPTPS